MARTPPLPRGNVTVGLNIDIIQRIDDLADRLRSTRSAVMRDCVIAGLTAVERKHPVKEPPVSSEEMPFPPTPA